MTARSIRPTAQAVVRRGQDLLVFEGRDRVKGETFFRPLGGGIEFGESAVDALRREMREELAVELARIRLLTVVENIFEHEGEPGHEIVFLFSAEIVDASVYTRDDLVVLDDGSPVRWLPLSDVVEGRAILYPTGLAEALS